jgi:hypothetical protein
VDSADLQKIQTNLKFVVNIEFFVYVDLLTDSKNLQWSSGLIQREKPVISASIKRGFSAVINLNPAFQRQQQRFTFSIDRFASRDFDPAFTDAVLLDVLAFFVVESNADVMLKNGGQIMRAASIDGQTVGQFGAGAGFSHDVGFKVLEKVHSR